jgi:hypothetical protein
MIKENGSWKLDLIGSIKFQIAEQAKANPTGAYITGSGNTDISIEGMEYDQDPVRLNDKGARFLIRLKNNGKSTIHQFVISLSINSNVVYESTVSYKLEAKEELVISVPIAAFWDKDIIRSAGEYRTDVIVSVGDEEEKNKTDDNWFYTITDFK